MRYQNPYYWESSTGTVAGFPLSRPYRGPDGICPGCLHIPPHVELRLDLVRICLSYRFTQFSISF